MDSSPRGRTAMLPICRARGARLWEHFDRPTAQPPDLEARRAVGAERVGDRATVELALAGIALAFRLRVGARIETVGLVVDHDEPPVAVAVEELDAAGHEPERTRALALRGRTEQHRQLAREDPRRE